jgi:hypothetical protein
MFSILYFRKRKPCESAELIDTPVCCPGFIKYLPVKMHIFALGAVSEYPPVYVSIYEI